MRTFYSYISCVVFFVMLSSFNLLLGQNQNDTIGIAGQPALEMDLSRLTTSLDSMMQLGLDSTIYPGAQLLVMRRGIVAYNKCFGHHTYERKTEVLPSNLYDLASLTKTLAGTLALMKLYDDRLLDLDTPFSSFFPEFKKSNKAKATLREILAHHARFQPYIVFWQKAQRKNGKYKWRTFKSRQSKRFPIKISDQLYLHRKCKKRIYKGIRDSELLPDSGYRYSGLAFLILPDLVRQLTGQSFENYLEKEVYRAIGSVGLGFNPVDKYPLTEIVPTENDTFFRHQLVHGTVHDENASMLGGISANAGLFGNARDISKVLQMLLDGGSARGGRFLSSETVEEFTRCQYCDQDNRRGLGFDKPLIDYNPAQAYTAESASPSSYGHSGFTGTFYWVDPDEELIIVLLTNRVHPTRDNRKLYSLNFRPTLHQILYDCLISPAGRE